MSTLSEKAKGSAKELAGDLTDDEDLQAEGEHQQEKARKTEEATELEEEAQRKRQQAAGHAGAEKQAS